MNNQSSLTNVAMTEACAINAPVTHLISSTFNSDSLPSYLALSFICRT